MSPLVESCRLLRPPISVAVCIALASNLSPPANAEEPYNLAGVKADNFGNIYISGSTGGSLGGPNAGAGDAFLIKYDASGSLLWSRQLGTSDLDDGGRVAVDGLGNAYLSGSTNGSLGGPNAGGRDVFLTKYDASGNLLWSRQAGTGENDWGGSVAVDGSGNAYISAGTAGSLGGPYLGGEFDAFVIKYDPSGNLLWSRQLGTASADQSYGVAVDGLGNAFITGWTAGNLDGPNAGGLDVFLTKYDPSGNLLWSRQVGTAVEDGGLDVATDGLGNAYIGGYTAGSLGGPFLGGNYDGLLIKYDASGNLLWSRQLGTAAHDSGLGVAADGLGNAYLTGQTFGSLGGPNAGSVDPYLAKYDASGNLLWSRQFGVAWGDWGTGVSVDGLGNAFVGGNTNNNGYLNAWLVKFAVPEPRSLSLIALAPLVFASRLPSLRPRFERSNCFDAG
jgi:hypothetical protein